MAYITIIAAIGKNRELGKNNDLLWHISEDLKNFKKVTLNSYIVMGRKTLESLPGLLPKRTHLVLTSANLEENEKLKCFKSMDDLLDFLNGIDEEVFIIGGASIYKEFIDIADSLLLTEIDEEKDADVYFPEFDKSKYKIQSIENFTCKDLKYKRILYKKKQGRIK